MASKIAIYNLAAGHLGQRPVSLTTEQSPVALAMSRAWDTSRQEAISASKWTFATAIEPLSAVATYTPPSGWAYGYQYPAKCLRLWRVFPVGLANGLYLTDNDFPGSTHPSNTAVERFRTIFVPSLNKKIILTGGLNAYGEYSYDLEDTTLWDPSFVTAMGYRLAADTAVALTGDSNVALNLMKVFNNAISDSKRLAAYQDTTDQINRGSTIDSRG